MDVLFEHGVATAAQVMDLIPDAPSYSAVRALLRILEEKGHAKHVKVGPRYVFSPVISRDKAKISAMQHTLSTFFQGSVTQAVAALLDLSEVDMSGDDLARLQKMITRAKKEGS